MKNCPRCGVGLNETEIGNLTVDGCIGCGGVWFDARELSAVAQSGSANLRTLEEGFWPSVAGVEKQDQPTCPNCSIPLKAFEFPHSPGIPLDGCTQCKGIWVDDGELAAVQERLGRRTEGQPSTAPIDDLRSRGRQALGFLAQVACPGCGQPNPAASPSCWACGIRLPGERGILCPRCDRRLHMVVRFGTRLDNCAHCGGIWLDGGELSVILTQPKEEIRKLDDDLRRECAEGSLSTPGLLLCPICHVPMELKPFASAGGAVLDTCMHCRGVWTDAGEFTPISESASIS
jgi:Zn-finger nucleic acid-binding protein